MFKWNENKIYKGSWMNNCLSGFGIYQHNGKVYKGFFFNDKKHGYGIYSLEGNIQVIGKWVEDIQDGLYILIEKNKIESYYYVKKNKSNKALTLQEEIDEMKKTEEYKKLNLFKEDMLTRGHLSF